MENLGRTAGRFTMIIPRLRAPLSLFPSSFFLSRFFFLFLFPLLLSSVLPCSSLCCCGCCCCCCCCCCCGCCCCRCCCVAGAGAVVCLFFLFVWVVGLLVCWSVCDFSHKCFLGKRVFSRMMSCVFSFLIQGYWRNSFVQCGSEKAEANAKGFFFWITRHGQNRCS